MANKFEDVGADFIANIIKTVDESEKAALEAFRKFLSSLDHAIDGPRHQVEDVIEAGVGMVEQFLSMSNDAAQRVTEAVRQALPEIEKNVRDVAATAAATASANLPIGGKDAPAAPAKKAAAKKAAAKKAPAKKAAAKKAPAKKAPAKKAPAKKAPAKKAPAKKAAAKKAPAKKRA